MRTTIARTIRRGFASGARDPKMSGCLVNLVTPFKDGTTEIDFKKLSETTERQVAAGVAGVIPLGTTGESFCVSAEEHRETVACVAEAVAGRCHVVAGTAHSDTAESLRLTLGAKAAGATACLVATPYFCKPGQEGMVAHYTKLATAGLPIVVYNVPGRTNTTMLPATVQRVFESLAEVVAIKEATANMDVATEIRMRCGDGLTLLSGDDSLALPLMSLGGRGVMSVASNLIPDEMVELCALGNAGKYEEALKLQLRLFPLFQSMVAEVNPVPVKIGMELLGLCEGNLRLPLTKATEATTTQVRNALKSLGKL